MSTFRKFAAKHGLDDTLYAPMPKKSAGDIVRVTELPKCDLCRENDAQYDAKIKGRSRWGYMCEECFQMYGEGLGTGKGQMLVVDVAQDHPVQKPEQSFEQWMAQVDNYVSALIGLSTGDLPDRPYYDEYEAGTTPKEMAKEIYAELESGELF